MEYEIVLLDPNGNMLKPVIVDTNEKCARVEAENLAIKYDREIGVRNYFAGKHIVYSVKPCIVREQP